MAESFNYFWDIWSTKHVTFVCIYLLILTTLNWVSYIHIMHQPFVSPATMGSGIAGIKFHVLNKASSPQCHGIWGYWFHAQSGWSNFTFTCQGFSRAFDRCLTMKMSLQCWARYSPDPKGLWLQLTGAVINTWSVSMVQPLALLTSDHMVLDLGPTSGKVCSKFQWHFTAQSNELPLYEPCHKKTCLQDLRPGKTQTSLHSHRS